MIARRAHTRRCRLGVYSNRGAFGLGSNRRCGSGDCQRVTTLFADIKGSTELMEDLDPEEARAIIDPALELMIDAVHRYDGYVVQSTGDGIFALFGAPVAHEDHPQRALFAALRMQEGLKQYSAKVVADGSTPIQGASVSTLAKLWSARSRPARVTWSTPRLGIRPTWPRGCRRQPRSAQSRLPKPPAGFAHAAAALGGAGAVAIRRS